VEKIRDLKNQIEELKLRLSECQETLQAIQSGEVDALVVHGPSGAQVYTLKNAEQPYRVMVETMNEGAATLALDSTIYYCNHKLASLLNAPLNKIIGAQMSDFIIPAHVSAFQSVLQGGTPDIGRTEVELKSAKGASIPVLVSTQDLFVENIRMVSLIVTDLSEHKAKDELEIRVKERTRELALANEQLRQYSYSITQIQEEERKRIAYELGEELAQTLAAIKLEADLMTEKVTSSLTNVNSHVDSIREMMGIVVHHATNFSNELRPSVLGSLGLPDALREIIKEMNGNRELEIVLKTNGRQRRLPDEIETALFRIAQEAMNNMIRHSGATKAKVSVGFLKTGIKLTIIDNGKGFDTERKPGLTLKNDLALIGMRERAHQIGGELQIKSELGKGTAITVIVPLQSN